MEKSKRKPPAPVSRLTGGQGGPRPQQRLAEFRRSAAK